MSLSEPVFRLQIVDLKGHVVHLAAGTPLEVDFIAACTNAIVSKGVGYLKGESHVRQAIHAGITEAIASLKQQSIRAL